MIFLTPDRAGQLFVFARSVATKQSASKTRLLRSLQLLAMTLARCQKVIIWLFFIFLLYSPAFCAEEPNISVKAEINKAFITIGDPVSYTITVKHHKSFKILSSISFPDADILKVKKSEDFSKKEGDMIYEGRKFTLTTFSLGEFVLTPIEVQYLDASGQNKTLKTDPIYITVKSVAEGEEKTDIRGVKGVIKIPAKYLPYLYATGGVLGFALLALLLLIFLRRKKPLAEELQLKHTIEEEALAQLNELFDSDLIRRGKVKEYYLRLSEILKLYFERRFKITALEATTYEVLKHLKDQNVDPGLQSLIGDVLEFSDLAKFAKFKPAPAEMIQYNQKSKQIIERAAAPKTN